MENSWELDEFVLENSSPRGDQLQPEEPKVALKLPGMEGGAHETSSEHPVARRARWLSEGRIHQR